MFKYLIILLVFISCNSNKSPEGVLRSFIEKRLNDEIKVDDLEDYLTGSLLEEYTQALNDDPKKLNEMSKFEKSRLSIVYKNCSGDECSITYSVSYDDEATDGKTKQDVSISVKKIALIIKKDDKWLISDISDVKSFYEFKETDVR
ncbi:hypothetical protein ACRXCV_00915 [Halobacteriovorax sp. GFR7]|uniref:hypothetical protein n=1 Tax=unclassified Halobacteriovorax TaxID=2639665 RepID=UPI0037192DCD